MSTTVVNPAEAVTLQPPPAAPTRQRDPLPDLLTEVTQKTINWQEEGARLDFEMRQWEHHQRMAKLFVMSGCFSDIKGQSEAQAIAQAMVKIELGRSMGFGAAESMKGIDLIQGRPAIAAELRAARMAANGYKWRFEEQSEKRVAILLFDRGQPLGNIEWTIEEAQRMGLTGKDNWKKSPSDMLWARCISRAQRRFAPHVLSVNILTREEAMDLDDVIEETTAATATRARLEQLKADQANRNQEASA